MTLVNTDQISKKTLQDLDNMEYAQQDMRNAYVYGYPGVLVSGMVWFITAIIALYESPSKAVWTLLFGGVLIRPVSILFNKVLGASGAHARSNPLGRLAMEGTIFMIMCIPLASGLSYQKVEWLFQGMLLIIGGRYLHFATLFGSKLYWVLGIGLAAAAYLLFTFHAPAYTTIFVGAAIEMIFGVVMLILILRKNHHS